MDRDGAFINPHQIFAILLWHLAGTRKLTGDGRQNFFHHQNDRQDRREIRPQSLGNSHRLQIHLRPHAGKRHPARRRRKRRHRNQAVLARARRHRQRPAARRSDGLARQNVSANWSRMLHAEFGEHHYGRVDLHVKNGQKEKAIGHFSADRNRKRLLDWPITRRENLDGIKVYLDDIGWVMVRASGTENMLRIYSETTRAETTKPRSRCGRIDCAKNVIDKPRAFRGGARCTCKKENSDGSSKSERKTVPRERILEPQNHRRIKRLLREDRKVHGRIRLAPSRRRRRNVFSRQRPPAHAFPRPRSLVQARRIHHRPQRRGAYARGGRRSPRGAHSNRKQLSTPETFDNERTHVELQRI